MGKVIKFLILATFFLSGDAFSQSKISNPPTPPPQAPQYDEYNSENRFNDFRSNWYRKAQIKSEGIKYNEEGLKPYLDDNYINLLKDALSNHGFFSITEHGLSDSLVDDCYKSSKEFFDLDYDIKNNWYLIELETIRFN
mgnify:CR=1 FL=1